MTVETDILRKNEVFTSDCKALNAISFPDVLIRFLSFYHAIRKLLCRNVYKSRGSMVHCIMYILYILYPSEEFLSVNLVSALFSFSGKKYEYWNI
jgi:hypothetical protein